MDNIEKLVFIDGEFQIEVNFSVEDESIWLSKEEITLLYGRDRSVNLGI